MPALEKVWNFEYVVNGIVTVTLRLDFNNHACMMEVACKNVWLLKLKSSIYLIVLDKTFFKIADYLTESEHPR